METQSRYPSAPKTSPETDFGQGPLRMNLYEQQPSSLPLEQNSSLPINGVARTTSKRRRPSESGNGKSTVENFTQPPAAPEVPKAPPVAYRAPPTTNGQIQSGPNHPPSFAERARILTGRPSPPRVVTVDSERTDQPQNSKPERRTSLNSGAQERLISVNDKRTHISQTILCTIKYPATSF